MEALKEYGIYFVLAINLLLVLVTASLRNAFASKKDLVALDARVTKTETALAALPNKDDFHELQLQLTKTVGDLKTVSQLMQSERNNLVEQMRRHEAILARHEQIFADAARGGK